MIQPSDHSARGLKKDRNRYGNARRWGSVLSTGIVIKKVFKKKADLKPKIS